MGTRHLRPGAESQGRLDLSISVRPPVQPIRDCVRRNIHSLKCRASYDVQLDIARLHIGRELTFLLNKGFNITADESIISATSCSGATVCSATEVRPTVGRLRSDKPTPGAKYLSPKEGGAQLYVPINVGPFKKQLVIAEGEFQVECPLRSGNSRRPIGGIQSALPNGEMLPALNKLLDLKNIIHTPLLPRRRRHLLPFRL